MTESPPAAAERDIDVLCLGAPVMSFVETAPATYLRRLDGADGITAIAAARSGARAAMAARIGKDAFGAALRALWEAEGVDAAEVTYDPAAPTGHIFRHLDTPDGPADLPEGTAAALMRPGDVSTDALRRSRVLHVSGGLCALSSGSRALADAVVRDAHATGTLISCALSFDAPGMAQPAARNAALSLMARADVALIGQDEAAGAFGQKAPEAILDHVLGMGPQVAALRLGPAGAWVASGQGRWRIGPMAVLSVDDAGAAGVFDGYFLSGLTAGDDLLTAATRANAAAAISTARHGTVEAIPHAAEVMI